MEAGCKQGTHLFSKEKQHHDTSRVLQPGAMEFCISIWDQHVCIFFESHEIQTAQLWNLAGWLYVQQAAHGWFRFVLSFCFLSLSFWFLFCCH
jgi:hypothetical protein